MFELEIESIRESSYFIRGGYSRTFTLTLFVNMFYFS